MKKYVLILSMIPIAIFALAISTPIMNLIGVPAGQELGPLVILFSVIFGTLTTVCFGLLGLRPVRRDGQWLIVDPAEERKRSQTRAMKADERTRDDT